MTNFLLRTYIASSLACDRVVWTKFYIIWYDPELFSRNIITMVDLFIDKLYTKKITQNNSYRFLSTCSMSSCNTVHIILLIILLHRLNVYLIIFFSLYNYISLARLLSFPSCTYSYTYTMLMYKLYAYERTRKRDKEKKRENTIVELTCIRRKHTFCARIFYFYLMSFWEEEKIQWPIRTLSWYSVHSFPPFQVNVVITIETRMHLKAL